MKLLTITISAVALLCLASGGHAQQPPATAPAVLVESAEMRPLARSAEFIGRVQAIEKVDLRARVEGFLDEQHFKEGATVTVDQVLFTIEPASFEANVAQQSAQLAATKATSDNTALKLTRARDLVQRSAVSQSQLDQAVADDANAKANVLQAEATLKTSQINLSYTKITAPIAGTIGRASVTPGNLVNSQSGVLATIVNQERVWVLFPVTQRELLDVRRKGGPHPMTVRARLADGSYFPENGTIDFLDVQSDPNTDTQIVRAVFSNPEHLLTDGQTVRVTIEQTEPEKVVAISLQALATDQGGSYVFVVGENNVVEQRRITLGVQRDGYVAVTEGLKANERVIVQGHQRVRPGQPVNPQLNTKPNS
jgi:membrane fusion protein, multidrug efflux system